MKMLNLDALVVPQMAVSIRGSEYPIIDMPVSMFLEVTAERERLKLDTEESMRTDVEGTYKLVRRLIPSMPEDVLQSLTFPQLFAVVSFINGQVDEIGKPAQAAAESIGAAVTTEGEPGKG